MNFTHHSTIMVKI